MSDFVKDEDDFDLGLELVYLPKTKKKKAIASATSPSAAPVTLETAAPSSPMTGSTAEEKHSGQARLPTRPDVSSTTQCRAGDTANSAGYSGGRPPSSYRPARGGGQRQGPPDARYLTYRQNQNLMRNALNEVDLSTLQPVVLSVASQQHHDGGHRYYQPPPTSHRGGGRGGYTASFQQRGDGVQQYVSRGGYASSQRGRTFSAEGGHPSSQQGQRGSYASRGGGYQMRDRPRYSGQDQQGGYGEGESTKRPRE